MRGYMHIILGDYNGGLRKQNTFVEFSKTYIDSINAYHVRETQMDLTFRKCIHSINFYDSVIVFERKRDDDIPVHSIR
jgi:hypothetical protein